MVRLVAIGLGEHASENIIKSTSAMTSYNSEQYLLWWRDTTMEPIESSEWMDETTENYTAEEIIGATRGLVITHLLIEGKIPSNIATFASKVEYVRVDALSNLDTEAAARLAKLTKLEKLVLAAIPTSVSALEELSSRPSLITLDLWSCYLKGLPSSLSQLQKLTKLNLSENMELSTEDLEVISEITSLEILDLTVCKLTHLPASFSKLVNLNRLLLYRNDFSSSSSLDILPQLPSLVDLDLSMCGLRDLPQIVSELIKLVKLNLSNNNLALSGFFDVVTSIPSLRELNLNECELTDLPLSLKHLSSLETLHLNWNKFVELPIVLWELSALQELSLKSNIYLQALDPRISSMQSLQNIYLQGCRSLTNPPCQVAEQGLSAIKQFYKDYEKSEGFNLPFGTVVVIGQSMAGKTSLIKTLQNGEERTRILTGQTKHEHRDGATKVFDIKEVQIDNTVLRFIDLGGHEVYHVTYQLTLREYCIPIVVIDIDQYRAISSDLGPREAVRRLFFDWLSHIYLAHPNLGPPKLVFTHIDLIKDPEELERLKKEFLKCAGDLRNIMLDEDKEMPDGKLCQIKHFADRDTPVFRDDDIFQVGIEFSQYEVFDDIKKNLFETSQKFVKSIPRIWEEIDEFLQSLPSDFTTFDELLWMISEKLNIEELQLEVVLTYMHDCGKLLWFKGIKILHPYIFHKIPVVTKLLSVLYDHNEELWNNRASKFKPFLIKESKEWLETAVYEKMVEQFLKSGIMNEILLQYLIRTETVFKSSTEIAVALTILQTFRLLHGPVPHDEVPGYILPYFAVGYLGDTFEEDNDLKFRVEIAFKGLSLPEYVYHQMTIGLFKLFSSDIDTPVVTRNGAVVYHNRSNISLIHDSKSRKAVILLSTDVESLADAWQDIIAISNNTVKHVFNTWTASRHVCTFYCTHCLLKSIPHPETTVNPMWYKPLAALQNTKAVKLHAGNGLMLCGKDRYVPVALMKPCQRLRDKDVEDIKQYVAKHKCKSLESDNPGSPPAKRVRLASQREDEVKIAKQKDGKEKVAIQREDEQKASNQREDEKKVANQKEEKENEDALSELSDGEGCSCSDDDRTALLSMNLRPTRNSKIKALFNNTCKVYKMTTPIRGRCLIINNHNFGYQASNDRHGSEWDVQNMTVMLEKLKFQVHLESNLEAMDILSTIAKETRHENHKHYGMFILVLMSQGAEDNHLYGSDMKAVKLKHIYDLLSPLNFPSMSGKPKLVIIQACSGDREDIGNRGTPSTKHVRKPELVEYLAPGPAVPPSKERKIGQLNVDDMVIIKSSFESYLSLRLKSVGSLFIRCLVSTFYNHACHRDVATLADIIQSRVREESLRLAEKYPESAFGQTTVMIKTLTHLRKLYLFPKYDAPRRL